MLQQDTPGSFSGKVDGRRAEPTGRRLTGRAFVDHPPSPNLLFSRKPRKPLHALMYPPIQNVGSVKWNMHLQTIAFDPTSRWRISCPRRRHFAVIHFFSSSKYYSARELKVFLRLHLRQLTWLLLFSGGEEILKWGLCAGGRLSVRISWSDRRQNHQQKTCIICKDKAFGTASSRLWDVGSTQIARLDLALTLCPKGDPIVRHTTLMRQDTARYFCARTVEH